MLGFEPGFRFLARAFHCGFSPLEKSAHKVGGFLDPPSCCELSVAEMNSYSPEAVRVQVGARTGFPGGSVVKNLPEI